MLDTVLKAVSPLCWSSLRKPNLSERRSLTSTPDLLLETPVLDKCDLNHNAVLILELCTGENSSQEIASLMQEAYSLPDPPCQMVEETVANLSRQGFLEST